MNYDDKTLIGVYGPSGSGKSSFCRLLADELGFKHIDLDMIGHEVLDESAAEISEAFPDCLIDGKISRKKLGEKVFNDKDELEKLNLISHPKIDEKIFKLLYELKGVVLIDGAIIHKSKIMSDLDLLVMLTCDRIIRVDRLVKNRNISVEKAENMADLFDGKFYDILVDTSLGLKRIKKEILELFSRYLERKNNFN